MELLLGLAKAGGDVTGERGVVMFTDSGGFAQPQTIGELVKGLEVLGAVSSRHVDLLLDVVLPRFFVLADQYLKTDGRCVELSCDDYDAALRTIRFLQRLRATWFLQEQADIRDHQEVV